MSWNLDLSTVDENDGGEKKTWAPLPKGSYKVILTGCDVDAEEKTWKKGAKYRSAARNV